MYVVNAIRNEMQIYCLILQSVVVVDNHIVEIVDSYLYLRQLVKKNEIRMECF
jgi:hypothetical protein